MRFNRLARKKRKKTKQKQMKQNAKLDFQSEFEFKV